MADVTTEVDRLVDQVLFTTNDPTKLIDGRPVPAMTTLLYGVCGNDADKFEEATRLVELFIRKTLGEISIVDGTSFLRELRGWRSYHNLAVLRLKVDVVGASTVAVKRAGDLVLAHWHTQPPFITGWMLRDVGFTCVLNEPDVEVIERP